jgi:transposase
MMTITNRCKNTNKVFNKNAKSQINSEEVHFLLKMMKNILSDYKNMTLTNCESEFQTLHLTLKSVSHESLCPECGEESIHTRGYEKRTVKILRIGSMSALLRVFLRKYECRNCSCKRKIFVEQVPWLDRYARYDKRCIHQMNCISLLMSSICASELLSTFGIKCSPNTCINHLLSLDWVPDRSARHVGLDDFALKRGHVYGTVIVNQDTHEIIELVASRDAEVITEVLSHYHNIETITRDRGKGYISAINRAAPKADAIADKFHLIESISEEVFNPVRSKFGTFRSLLEKKGVLTEAEPVLENGWLIDRMYAVVQGMGTEKGRMRMTLWKEVNCLHNILHKTIPEIGDILNLRSKHIGRFLRTAMEDYMSDMQIGLNRQLNNIAAVILERGTLEYKVISKHIGKKLPSRWIARLLAPIRDVWERKCKEHQREKKQAMAKTAQKDDLKDLWRSFFIFGHLPKSKAAKLFMEEPGMKDRAYYCSTFQGIMSGKVKMSITKWATAAMASGFSSIEAFAKGIMKDYKAVRNAIRYKQNNGLLEGSVCKIKSIKRVCYGRASFRLLAVKVLYNSGIGRTTF